MDQREQWMAAVQARLERVTTTHDLHPVLEETALYEARELSRTITDDPGSLPAMYILGWLHWYRYQALPEGHDQQDLQAAVSMFTPCFMHGTSGLPGPLLPLLADLAIRVATQLLELTQRTGDLELLTATAGLWRRIVAATPADHPGRAERLSNLAAALRARFRCTEVLADLDAAIDAWQQALNATPADHPDRAAILSNLGNALRVRFERTGATTDLDAAIDAGQQAVDATPADHPDRARILSNFGNALVTRFERTRVAADLDAAIDTAQQALNATPADHPDRAAILSNLGNALRIRFERTGAAADLDAAIDTAQQALNATPADHPDRAGRLSNLGNALRTRYERTGATADLDAAIHAGQQAVHATPADHPNRAAILSNLGNALRTRYERTGATADLDAAIHAGQQAVHATPADRPDRAAILSNLGNALQARYERTGASTDLDAAVDTAQQALNATPADHPDRAGCLSNLSDTLRTRYGRTGAIADLDAAIDTAQQAINATPADHPDRAGWLSSLGNALQARYERTGATADLDAAIHAGQQAVNATPADHPSRARRLSNLGNALRTRYERTGAIADLDAAIDTGQQAVNATPADHPSRAGYLFNLGNALRARFERTEAAKDLDAAFQRYSEATSVDMAAASVRIGAGYAAARLVTEADPGRAASLLEAAVLLLPEVAARFLERGDQQYAIGRFAGLAAEAAAAALSDPAMPELQRPARALGLLEAARGVLLSQALSTRGDLSELRDRHPELARRFTELRDWLDQPSPATSTDLVMPGNGSVDAQRYEIRDRRQAAAEFTQLLARIRDLDGFAAFALPPSAEQLETQGGQGPVVVFNVAAHRSDAILLTSDGITSHPLPELNQAKVIDQIGAFHRALGTITGTESPLAGDDAESPLAGDDAEEALRQVLGWLWDNAAGPVLHALGYQDPPPPGQPWPQVWWSAGGLLSLLPVHAAGHHIDPPDPAGRIVMDRVISSYTPTVGALAYARTPRAAAADADPRSLIVAMPTTPGLPGEGRLRYAAAEAAMVQHRLPSPTLLTEPPADRDATAGQVPTRAAVLKHLPRSAIAHFACHGHTDLADPSQSRLLLHDHLRNPLTVAALASFSLDHARLAYLSACSTARIADARLLDEAIHLTSAFQLAGFPHVIGTLWEIDDEIAVEIADSFYAALTDADGALDPDLAARALHHAARAQRNQHPAAPYLWASHIHAGA